MVLFEVRGRSKRNKTLQKSSQWSNEASHLPTQKDEGLQLSFSASWVYEKASEVRKSENATDPYRCRWRNEKWIKMTTPWRFWSKDNLVGNSLVSVKSACDLRLLMTQEADFETTIVRSRSSSFKPSEILSMFDFLRSDCVVFSV